MQAISQVESSGRPNLLGPVTAMGDRAAGLMQFMPKTAAEYGVADPMQPAQAIPGATRKFRDLLNQHGDVTKALMGYNAGNPSRWDNPETQAYPGKVAAAYTQLRGQAMPQPQAPGNDPFSALLSHAQTAVSSPAQDAPASLPDMQGGSDPFSGLISQAASTVTSQQAEKARLTPGFINGLVRSIANGVTFGYADKLDALTESAVTGKPYSQAISDQRQTDSNFSADHPVVSTAGELGGGVAGMLVGGGALAGTKAAAVIGGLPSIARSAAVGGIVGGLSGAGNTDGSIGDQIAGAAQGAGGGAILGGALGLVAPMVGQTVGKGVQAAVDRFGTGPDTAAGRKLAQAMQRDGISPADLQARIQVLGPDAAAVDAGGANVRNLAESVANSPGAGAQQASSFLQGRMEGQGDRINQAINTATGGDANFHANIDQLMAQRSAAAAPLYDQALNSGAVHNDRIAQFLADPVMKQGLRQGLEVQRLESLAQGKPFNPTDYAITGFNDAGDPVIGDVPNMRTLDAAKRGLDNILEQYRDPTTGRMVMDQRGRAIDQVRQAYLKQIDAINPAYAEARGAWAGPSQAMDALAAGREILNKDPEVITKIAGNLTPADKDFFLTGVARALKDKVSGAADGADATRKIFGNSLIRQKLQAALGDPNAYQQFQGAMERENQFAQTRNAVLSNSATARRLAGQQDASVDPSPLVDILRGRYLSGLGGLARSGYNALTATPSAQGERLGNLLFSPGGANIGPALNSSTNRLVASQALRNKLLMLGAGDLAMAPPALQSRGQNP